MNQIYTDRILYNCNYCTYRVNVSQHWDMEDYCSLNKKKTVNINMDKDCPLERTGDINGTKRQSGNCK